MRMERSTGNRPQPSRELSATPTATEGAGMAPLAAMTSSSSRWTLPSTPTSSLASRVRNSKMIISRKVTWPAMGCTCVMRGTLVKLTSMGEPSTTTARVYSLKRRLYKGSRRIHNHGEGPYWGLLLVESCYKTFVTSSARVTVSPPHRLHSRAVRTSSRRQAMTGKTVYIPLHPLKLWQWCSKISPIKPTLKCSTVTISKTLKMQVTGGVT